MFLHALSGGTSTNFAVALAAAKQQQEEEKIKKSEQQQQPRKGRRPETTILQPPSKTTSPPQQLKDTDLFKKDVPGTFLVEMERVAFDTICAALATAVKLSPDSRKLKPLYTTQLQKLTGWTANKQKTEVDKFVAKSNDKQVYIVWMFEATYKLFCQETARVLGLVLPEQFPMVDFVDVYYTFLSKLPHERDVVSMKWLKFSHRESLDLCALLLKTTFMELFFAKTIPALKPFHEKALKAKEAKRRAEKEAASAAAAAALASKQNNNNNQKPKKYNVYEEEEEEDEMKQIHYVDDDMLPDFEAEDRRYEQEKYMRTLQSQKKRFSTVDDYFDEDFSDTGSIFSAGDMQRRTQEYDKARHDLMASVKTLKRGLDKINKHVGAGVVAGAAIVTKKSSSTATSQNKHKQEKEKENEKPPKAPPVQQKQKVEVKKEEVVGAAKEIAKEEPPKIEQKNDGVGEANNKKTPPKMTPTQVQLVTNMLNEKKLQGPSVEEVLEKKPTATMKSHVIAVGDDSITIYGDEDL